MKHREDIIFLIILIIIMLGGFIKPFIKPIDIVYIENRSANKIPDFKLESFLDKSYQESFEKALSDQIPLSGKMKLFEKNLTFLTQSGFYKTLDKNAYYKLSTGIDLFNDYLVYTPYCFSDIKNSIDNKILNINEYLKDSDGIKKYLYYIEKDTDIDFVTNDKLGVYEYISAKLNDDIITSKFEINNFEDFSNYFYKTDHHWNYRGSYRAYKELVQLMTNDEPLKYIDEICTESKIDGSKAANLGAANLFDEYMCAYLFELKEHDVYINGQKVEGYGNYKNILKSRPNKTTYGDFYGGDAALLEFDYHNSNKENLLIIGESYDNAINELLAAHFNKTFNVDLRNYKDSGFDVKEFIVKNNIKNLLLIGNIDFYILKTFNLGVGK